MPQVAGRGYKPILVDSDPSDNLQLVAEARGLNMATLQRAGVRVDHEESPGHPIFIPYPNMQGSWYERQRRWIGIDDKPKYLSPRHSEPHLYNPSRIGPEAEVVWICEGEFDTLCMIEIGRSAVGVGGASSFDKRWALLWQYSTIVMAFDDDDTGQQQQMKIAALFPTERVHYFIPTGDLNDMHQKDTLFDAVLAFEAEWGIES